MRLEIEAEYPDKADDDEIQRDYVIQQARHNQDKYPRDERHDWSEG